MIVAAAITTRPLSVLMLDYGVGGEVERGAVLGVITTALVVGIALVARRFGMGMRSEV